MISPSLKRGCMELSRICSAKVRFPGTSVSSSASAWMSARRLFARDHLVKLIPPQKRHLSHLPIGVGWVLSVSSNSPSECGGPPDRRKSA